MSDQYAPHLNTLTLGAIVIEGFAKGTFIKVTKTEDSVDLVEGVEGNGTFVHKLSKRHEIEFVLAYGAESNDLLAALVAANDRIPGSGVVPVSLKNQMGRGFLTAAEGAVMKMADQGETDQGGEDKTWKIVCSVEPGAYFPGGL